MAEQDKGKEQKKAKEQQKATPSLHAQPDDQSPRRNEGQEEDRSWFVEDSEGNRAQSTPEADRLPDHLTGMPEGHQYVGLTRAMEGDAVAEQQRQRAENYPVLPEHYFDPEAHAEEYSDLHTTMRGTCFVTVNEEVVHDGYSILPGVQELPKDIAQALVDQKVAFEPAGQKPS